MSLRRDDLAKECSTLSLEEFCAKYECGFLYINGTTDLYHSIPNGESTLGADDSCSIRLTEDGIAPRHANLVSRARQLHISGFDRAVYFEDDLIPAGDWIVLLSEQGLYLNPRGPLIQFYDAPHVWRNYKTRAS